MQEDIKDTELYRGKLKDRILWNLYREWLEVVAERETPELDYDLKMAVWDVPKQIMMRVIQEMVDEGWLKDMVGIVTLTAEGRKECKRRGFDKKN